MSLRRQYTCGTGARASPAVVPRRRLSLDYVVDHPGEPWLATEAEKVSALRAAGAPEEALPRRVYRGRRGSQCRYFAHKPAGGAGRRAGDVCVRAGRGCHAERRADVGEVRAGLWAALRAAGRAVEVVVEGGQCRRRRD